MLIQNHRDCIMRKQKKQKRKDNNDREEDEKYE